MTKRDDLSQVIARNVWTAPIRIIHRSNWKKLAMLALPSGNCGLSLAVVNGVLTVSSLLEKADKMDPGEAGKFRTMKTTGEQGAWTKIIGILCAMALLGELHAQEEPGTGTEERGDAKSFLELGQSFLKPASGEPDYAEAIKAFEKAAELGTPEACCELGKLYQRGRGVAWSSEKAFQYFQRGADAGHLESLLELGNAYRLGRGVAKDETKGFQLTKRSSDGGFAKAHAYLGWCYEDGQGVAVSLEESIRLYQKAISVNEPYGHAFLGFSYAEGAGVEQSFEKGNEHYLIASAAGNGYASSQLGWSYKLGEGVEKSPDEARRYFRLAIEQGDSSSYGYLGDMLPESEAFALYQKGSEAGDGYCSRRMGVAFQLGDAMPKSNAKAERFFRLAIEQDSEEAMAHALLGILCIAGAEGVEQDIEEGKALLQQVVELGDVDTIKYVGEAYAFGLDVPKSGSEALKYFKAAAKGGDTDLDQDGVYRAQAEQLIFVGKTYGDVWPKLVFFRLTEAVVDADFFEWLKQNDKYRIAISAYMYDAGH